MRGATCSSREITIHACVHRWKSHREKFGVHCLARGYFDLYCRGLESNHQPSDWRATVVVKMNYFEQKIRWYYSKSSYVVKINKESKNEFSVLHFLLCTVTANTSGTCTSTGFMSEYILFVFVVVSVSVNGSARPPYWATCRLTLPIKALNT